MFDEVPGGLPMHPLVIHLVVLAIPLTLALAVLFAIPRFRNWARWPLALVSVGALAATWVATQSGEALATSLEIFTRDSPVRPLIAEHSRLAGQLLWLCAVVAVLGVLAAVLVGRGTPERTGTRRGLDLALLAALVVVSAVASFWAYRVGDLGARAVWNPTGTQSFQVDG